jgi:hypothetical protein
MPLLPPSPRISGGITGAAKANVDKIYRQMEEEKKKAAPPAQRVNPSRPPSVSPRRGPDKPMPRKTSSAFENRMQ